MVATARISPAKSIQHHLVVREGVSCLTSRRRVTAGWGGVDELYPYAADRCWTGCVGGMDWGYE